MHGYNGWKVRDALRGQNKNEISNPFLDLSYRNETLACVLFNPAGLHGNADQESLYPTRSLEISVGQLRKELLRPKSWWEVHLFWPWLWEKGKKENDSSEIWTTTLPSHKFRAKIHSDCKMHENHMLKIYFKTGIGMVDGQNQPAICFCTVHELKWSLQVYKTERKSK